MEEERIIASLEQEIKELKKRLEEADEDCEIKTQEIRRLHRVCRELQSTDSTL